MPTLGIFVAGSKLGKLEIEAMLLVDMFTQYTQDEKGVEHSKLVSQGKYGNWPISIVYEEDKITGKCFVTKVNVSMHEQFDFDKKLTFQINENKIIKPRSFARVELKKIDEKSIVERKPKPEFKTKAESDAVKLQRLQEHVARATQDYIKHSKSIRFCLFHWHGETGRKRATQFNEDFSKITDLGEAKKQLVSYLGNKKNGNTHAHSFRTMLLREVLESSDTLGKTSLGYKNKLGELGTRLNVSKENPLKATK